MTRAQLIAVLAAMGASFGAGSAFDYSTQTTTLASISYPHALRLERGRLEDGGLAPGPDVLTAYRTRATEQTDGGLDLEDIGQADCTGDTADLRTYARNNCRKVDGGFNLGVYALEARPTTLSDGGAGVEIQTYGEEQAHCTGNKTPLFRAFVGSLNCATKRVRSGASPL